MVVAVSPPAVDAGVQTLREGGTAVDAAVTVALAMAVTYPPAGNIGGGGFMLIHPVEVQPVCIDYRERAPDAATPDMFRLGETRFSRKIVGVPGTVRGLALAHARFGVLPWKRLVQPAVRLARAGFPVDAALAESLNEVLADPETQPFTEFRRVFAPPDGQAWHAGDLLVQPDLAHTMQRLADEGPDAFYEGAIAEQIVAEMQAPGGLITAADLANYRARIRTPVQATYRGHQVYGPALPSSGGVCLALLLNMLEPMQLRARGRWSADTLHRMIECMRRAYRDRARYLGDRDFVDVPEFLTQPTYAQQLASGIAPRRATPSAALAGDIALAPEGPSTTHFSIVDRHGTAVSNTYTLEYSYGSRVVVRGAGFLLNNEMGDFNWKPGHTDRVGHIGTPANRIAPGKRMLSSQTPVIVARNGRPVLVTGSPGGRTIINTALCLVLNVLEFEMDLPEAVQAPRLHHQWFPDSVRFEGLTNPAFADTIETLRAWGHEFVAAPGWQGDAHSIQVDPDSGTMTGVADPRIHGKAAGY